MAIQYVTMAGDIDVARLVLRFKNEIDDIKFLNTWLKSLVLNNIL